MDKKFSLFLPILLGIIFFAFNSWYSYSFYHVNSFKILYMGCFILFLFVLYDIFLLSYNGIMGKKLGTEFHFPWKETFLFLLPVLGTFPGYLFHWNEPLHYNHNYELVTRLVVLMWMVYIFRFLKTDKAIFIFLIFAGVSMFYVWFFGILETYNNSPFLYRGESFSGRIKVTYGNINYLAGAMVPIIPIFLSLAIPKIERSGWRVKFQAYFNKPIHFLFLFFFLISAHTLLLTVTRAAITASILSILGLLFFLFISTFDKQKRLKYFLYYGSIFFLLLLGVVVVMFLFRDVLSPFSRFFTIFYLDTWYGRFIAWEPSIEGFLNSPWIGYGLGVSYNLFFKFINPDSRIFWGQRSYNHTHSEWFEYLTEGGLFGYLCFFILWGYVFYHLIKFFFHPKTSIFHKRVMLGAGAGMLGFYMHGVFSVSQRMIVTNIPQFALLGIAFVLIAYNKKILQEEDQEPRIKWLKEWRKISEIWLKKWNQIPFLFRNQLPCLIIILAVFFLYYPWAKTQYEFVKISKAGRSIFQTAKLENLKKQRKDIYMMDSLTRWQISYKRYDLAIKNIQEMEKIIPNYRINGFFLGLNYFYQGKVREAHQALKKYVVSDNFYDPATNLFHKLTTLVNDKQGHLDIIKYAMQKSVGKNKFPYFDLSIHSSQKENIAFKEKKNGQGLEVSFSSAFLDQNFAMTANHYRANNFRKGNPNTANEIINMLNSQILSAALRDKFIELIPKSDNFEDEHSAKLLEQKLLSQKDVATQFHGRDWKIEELSNIIQNAEEVSQKLSRLWGGLLEYKNTLSG